MRIDHLLYQDKDVNMLTEYISRPIHHKEYHRAIDHRSGEISRLLAAAVINKRFRDLLLSDPARALAEGFHGETFQLTHDQKMLVLSIRADKLSDFALQLTSDQVSEKVGSSGEWVPFHQPAFAIHSK
jgi:hypothetical protein